MKIEKLSDNQIRCTLKKADLASRHLKISELAYGSDKAKELFRDIMKQAAYEFGFEANDIPLMIEAIPVSSECIVLIVTKVDDPEELDTRFSKFSSLDSDEEDYTYPYAEDFDTLSAIEDIAEETAPLFTASDELDVPAQAVANDVLNLFSKLKDCFDNHLSPANSSMDKSDANHSANPSVSPGNQTANSPAEPVARIFVFDSFDAFLEAANAALTVYNDKNSLYKSNGGQYYLVIEKTVCSALDFNKVCNILSEFGTKENSSAGRLQFFQEHFTCLIGNRAIQVAGRLSGS